MKGIPPTPYPPPPKHGKYTIGKDTPNARSNTPVPQNNATGLVSPELDKGGSPKCAEDCLWECKGAPKHGKSEVG